MGKSLGSLVVLLTTLLMSIHSLGEKYSLETYYRTASGLEGYALKTAVKKIISQNHRDRGYDGLLNIYFESDADRDYENDGSIMDMYSENPGRRDDYNFSSRSQACGEYQDEADCYNREHLFPQSIFHKQSPMRNDFFQVYPTDGYVNNRRGSLPFGEVHQVEWQSLNGSKLGANAYGTYSGLVFEPIDAFKGDIARALLYFATRYEDNISQWRHPMLNGTSSQVYANWFIALLVKWHRLDPVSEHERRRNEVGFRYQGNRNPYIDHPEWVQRIWKIR